MDGLDLRLSRILAALPFLQRQALLEVDILGLSLAKASARLGITRETLEHRLALGRREVAARIGEN